MKTKTKAPSDGPPAWNIKGTKLGAAFEKHINRKTEAEECIALLGGMLAGLCMVRDIKDVREAVQWWGRNHKSWTHFAEFHARERTPSK